MFSSNLLFDCVRMYKQEFQPNILSVQTVVPKIQNKRTFKQHIMGLA